jgi:O-antigen biosynthesis protein
MVLTVTEAEAEVLHRERVKATLAVIPNIHEIPTEVRQEERKRNTMLFVGGFQHEPNVDGILYFCKKILPLIRGVIPDVRLSIVGSFPP